MCRIIFSLPSLSKKAVSYLVEQRNVLATSRWILLESGRLQRSASTENGDLALLCPQFLQVFLSFPWVLKSYANFLWSMTISSKPVDIISLEPLLLPQLVPFILRFLLFCSHWDHTKRPLVKPKFEELLLHQLCLVSASPLTRPGLEVAVFSR